METTADQLLELQSCLWVRRLRLRQRWKYLSDEAWKLFVICERDAELFYMFAELTGFPDISHSQHEMIQVTCSHFLTEENVKRLTLFELRFYSGGDTGNHTVGRNIPCDHGSGGCLNVAANPGAIDSGCADADEAAFPHTCATG